MLPRYLYATLASATADLEALRNHLYASQTRERADKILEAFEAQAPVSLFLSATDEDVKQSLKIEDPPPATFNGTHFHDTAAKVHDIFADRGTYSQALNYSEPICPLIERSSEYVNRIRAVEPLESHRTIPCGLVDRIIISDRIATVLNVKNVDACQKICQSFVDIFHWFNCDSTDNSLKEKISSILNTDTYVSPGVECKGITYYASEGSCILHKDIEALATLEGSFAAPALCRNHEISVHPSVYEKAKNVNSQCIKNHFQRLSPLSSEVIEKINRMVNWTEPEYSADWVNDHNPEDLPNVFKQKLMDTRMLVGKRLHVKSWRDCVFVCYNDPSCTWWNVLTLNNATLCYLSSNVNNVQLTESIPEEVMKAYAGVKPESLDPHIFATTKSDSYAAKAWKMSESSSPISQSSCDFVGYVGDIYPGFVAGPRRAWQISFSSAVGRLHVTVKSASECKEACLGHPDCKAWQYRHSEASIRLTIAQPATCELLNDAPYNLFPTIDNEVAFGFNSMDCANKAIKGGDIVDGGNLLKLIAAYKAEESENDTVGSFRTFNQFTSDDPSTHCSTLNSTMNATSIAGELTNDGKVITLASSEECRKNCDTRADCKAWSYGTWGGCYFYKSVRGLVHDSEVVSGLTVCVKNIEPIKVEWTKRTIQSCSNGRLNRILQDGEILKDILDEYKTSQECFDECRKTKNCFYMTFIGQQKKYSTAEQQGSGIVSENEYENKTMCRMWSAIHSSKMARVHKAFSTPSNCDGLGIYENL